MNKGFYLKVTKDIFETESQEKFSPFPVKSFS